MRSASQRKRIITLSISVTLIVTQAAQAGPFVDFFRALRHSITHPEQPRSHRGSVKQHGEAVSSDASSHASSNAVVTEPPNGRNTRTATKVTSATKEGKNGLLYGTPVPGEPGLVTSPFAPDSGYVNVRGFPPGTQVKDPYTGKIFLTP